LPVEIVGKLINLYSLTQLTHNIFVFYIHVNIIAMCIQFTSWTADKSKL